MKYDKTNAASRPEPLPYSMYYFELIRLLNDGQTPEGAAKIISEYYGMTLHPDTVQEIADTASFREHSLAVQSFDDVRLADIKTKWACENGGKMQINMPPMLLGHIESLEEVRQDVLELFAAASEHRDKGSPNTRLEEQLRRVRVLAFDLRKEIHARTAGSLAASRAKDLIQEVAVIAARALGRYIPESTQELALSIFKSEVLRLLEVVGAEHEPSR